MATRPSSTRPSKLSRTLVRAAAGAGVLALATVGIAPAGAHQGGDVPTNTRGLEVATDGQGERMSFVANLQYNDTGEAQDGSDIEFMRLGKKKYALAGTLRGGMQIIDITRPRKPERVAVYDCAITQGDIQVFNAGGRVLASYTADGTFGAAGAASQCGRDLNLDAGASGTVLVDLTRPDQPQTVSYLAVPRGSHNMTIHPNGRYLYNSNSDLATSTSPTVTIYDVSQPEAPKKVQDYPLPYVPTSLGSEAHDITFNESGTRAYVAALSQTLVLDTTDPENPKQVGQIIDPSINVVHQSDPVTLTRPDGTQRDLLVITDERAGAAASAECPGGGLHVYDITGDKEKSPEKVGAWFIPATQVQDGATCTSHVLRIYPEQQMATIAWYAQGVRVLDISGLATAEGGPTAVAFGDGIGIKEVGHYVLPDSDTWSFKTDRIKRDGSFYGYGNDLVRGFDVYHFEGLTDRKVKPMRAENVAPRAKAGSNRALLPLAVVVPALVGTALLRRRTRSA